MWSQEEKKTCAQKGSVVPIGNPKAEVMDGFCCHVIVSKHATGILVKLIECVALLVFAQVRMCFQLRLRVH